MVEASVGALHELLDIAAEPRDLIGFRRAALSWCERHLGADQLAVGGPTDMLLTEHATSSVEVCEVTCNMWKEIGRYEATLTTLLGAARARGGAVQATDAVDGRAREHRRFFGEILEPIGAHQLAIAPLCVGGAVVGVLGLGRSRGVRPFAPEQLALMGRAAQVIAMGDALRLRAPALGAELGEPAAPGAALRRQLPSHAPLTAREREIVELVVMGLTNAQIALALGTSPNTVRKQLVAVFRKLDVGSRAELVRAAMTELPAGPAPSRATA